MAIVINNNVINAICMFECIGSDHYTSSEFNDLNNGINYPLPDLTYLKVVAEGDEAFVKEIITYFVEFTPEVLRSMHENALNGDLEKLRFAAHALLPQLSFVGILAAIPAIEKIELEGKLNDDLFVELNRGIEIIKQGIEDLKKMI